MLNISLGKERHVILQDEFVICKSHLRQCSERFAITFAAMEALLKTFPLQNSKISYLSSFYHGFLYYILYSASAN